MKVLQVIHTTGHGGAENVFRWLAWQLSREGIEVVACIPAHDPRQREYWIGPAMAELKIPCATFERNGNGLELYGNIRSMIRREKPDIVHSHLMDSSFYSSLASWRLDIPHVSTEHGDVALKRGVRSALKYLSISAATDALVCVSRALAESVRKRTMFPAKIRVVPNGIAFRDGDGSAFRRELGIPEGALLVGNVANLYPVKGQEFLVRAFSGLLTSFPEARLVIVGRGRERERLEDLTRALRIPPGRVILTGFRGDVENVMSALDIYAQPSLSEGLPVSLLEAMFTGVPVIATDVGGVPEVLGEVGHGTLVPPGSAEELLRALREVSGDIRGYREKAGLAREDVRTKFSLPAMARGYIDTYRHVLGRS
jgi:glycosyltransferase involved in cell wall biosynthesis